MKTATYALSEKIPAIMHRGESVRDLPGHDHGGDDRREFLPGLVRALSPFRKTACIDGTTLEEAMVTPVPGLWKKP